MLIERRLRLITPILAAKRSNDPASPRRVFVHLKTPKGEADGKVYLRADLPRWTWAFLEARDALSLGDVCLGAVLPSHWYSVHRTSTYNRQFRRGKERATEQFESIPSGHVMRMKFTLSNHIPPGTDGEGRFTRAPDETEFDDMLAYIGEHLGMSEWGHALKLGRFEIRPPISNDTSNQGDDDSVPDAHDDSEEFVDET
jgi:hypothetical protein